MIFSNPAIDAEFQKYGYAVVDLLDDAIITELTEIYKRHPPPARDLGFVANMLVGDQDYGRAVDTEIKQALAESLKKVIPNYRVYQGSFVVKVPRMQTGVVGLHQDPAFVDELQHTHVTVWCPLVEVSEKNGWLAVVAGSHHFNRGFRSQGPLPYPDLQDLIMNEYLTYFPMRPGQVIFLHPRMFHCSPMNYTEELRIVAAGALAPLDCEQFYYCHRAPERGPNALEVYKVNEDFYWDHLLGTRPKNVPLDKVLSVPHDPVDKRRLAETCGPLVRDHTDGAIVEAFAV